MRDTRSSLLISGGLAAGSSAMIATGATLFETQGESALTIALIFIGLMIAPISIIWFIGSAVTGARKEALESGAGEIARWRLSANEWAAFRAQEKRMVAAGHPINLLNLRSGEPQDGDVIFARKAVIADEDYQSLIPGGVIDLIGVEYVQGAPSCLQFAMRAHRGPGASGVGMGYDHSWLRVPIAAGETREAMKVMKHYSATTRRSPALAMINPKLTRQICFGIAAICAISAIWGFLNSQTRAYGDAPLYAAVIGVIAGLGALLLAAIVSYRLRVDKR